MLKETVSIDEVIDLLNEIIDLDNNAVNELVNNRVQCSEALAKHPFVQVIASFKGKDKEYCLGLIGIINGFFGVDDNVCGAIAAYFNSKGELISFRRYDKDAPTSNPLKEQIDLLAKFILKEFPDEPGKTGVSEGAIDVAIRLLSEFKEKDLTSYGNAVRMERRQ